MTPPAAATSPVQTREGRTDALRQVVVAASAVLAVLGTAIGVGAFGGTPIAQAAGGALSADATLVAPAGPAFAIWTPIYAGLVGYALWQLAPARRADPRQRRVGWWVAVTMLLNAAWILTVQSGALALSVLVIAVLLVALVVTFARVVATRSQSRVENLVLDVTVGVYLGWVSIATVANVAAALVAAGAGGLWLGVTTWAVVMLVVAAAVGVGVAWLTVGRLSYALALGWGLAWVSVGRATGANVDTTVAAVAALAAVVVIGSAAAVRRRR
jgi:hypothetical protein